MGRKKHTVGTELAVVVPEEKVAQKKGKKEGSKQSDMMDDDRELGDYMVGEEDDDVALRIKLDGKNKSKGKESSTGFSALSFGLLEEDDYERKDDDEDKDVSAIKFSGKKKSSEKKKNVSADTAVEIVDDASPDFVEPVQRNGDSEIKKQASGDPTDTSKNTNKNKKKNKTKTKGGKTGDEEEDLDKILAQLDAAPIVPPAGEKVQHQSELEYDKEAEDKGPMESVTSKKKKKKKKDKEKDQEKQEETKIETNNNVPGKKVPKHIREIQEKIAKQKEAEERKKQQKKEEEEERLRKEEKEAEEERLVEEKKRLKKEKEKQKLLKKKQEGKLLTAKQKEEVRKREAMRTQLLASASGLRLPSQDGGAPAKRPLYEKKKPPKAQLERDSVGAKNIDCMQTSSSEEPDSVEAKDVDCVESSSTGDHGLRLPSQDGGAPAKRPLYEKKKQPKAQLERDSVRAKNTDCMQTSSSEEQDSVEAKDVDCVESSSTEDQIDAIDVVEENGVDDEEEADVKEDWEEADFKLHGKRALAADGEVDLEHDGRVKKKLKNSATATSEYVERPSITTKPDDLAEKAASTIPLRSDKENIKQVPKEETPNSELLRSPICCIMGHVDTGKTKLLDCIRGTNVQEGEAGGITQQIGATYFPAENIRERTKELKADAKLNVPGLLVIDTPGHESFTNLRSRGSGLCDIAILVVDITHGLKQQTIESLNLLKMRNTDFIVALNKVDKLYGWKTCRNAPIAKAMKQQSKPVQMLFNDRLTQIITQFKEQGVNTELYYKNKDRGETFNIVPTSAVSGEGIADLLLLLVGWTQKTMTQRLTFRNQVQCIVLDVKVVEGLGTTLDVVLVNGVLHEGDKVVLCGLQVPIVTTIRALLTPHPMKELRVKGTYLHHKEIKAAQGIKITAQGLEHAIAGSSLYVVGPGDDLEDIKNRAMEDMDSVMSRIDTSGEGVYVQASTLGSLEALVEYLKSTANVPVSGVSIGPVHRKDVIKASVMLGRKKEYATVLAFDVKVDLEATGLADDLGVTIFTADTIYRLFEQYEAYIKNLKEQRKKEAADKAVFPCVLKIIPKCVFNKKDPIVLGVDVVEGTVKIGTPLCVPGKGFIDGKGFLEIGRIASIVSNQKPVEYAKKGQSVSIKIIGTEQQKKMVFGKNFGIEDELVSSISRNSLDALKDNFKDEISQEDKSLLFKLKKIFKIP